MVFCFNIIDAQKVEVKLKQTKKALEAVEVELTVTNNALIKANKNVADLTAKLKKAEKIIPVPIPPAPPVKTWKKEYDDERVISAGLRKNNRRLSDINIALEDSLARERRKVENLEYEKTQLEIKVEDLETSAKKLKEDIGKLEYNLKQSENHVRSLQRDSTVKEETISKQNKEINTLEAVKIRLVGNKNALREVSRQQKNELGELKDKNKGEQIQQVSSYLGINYNFTQRNNNPLDRSPIAYDGGVISNFSLSWYNSLVGGYFSIPMNYCNTNPFAKCDDCDITNYYSIRDIETIKMSMDIKGIWYQDLNYLGSENHLKTYSAGINAATIKYFYLSLGASVLKGCSWDLYSGDLSGYGNNTPDISAPIKNNDGNYIVNYQNHSVIKPTIGVAFVAPFQKINGGRDENTKIRSKVFAEHNYKLGFQVEIGYDWLYEDFYAKGGIHIRLWNYDQNTLDKSKIPQIFNNEIIVGVNQIIKGNDRQGVNQIIQALDDHLTTSEDNFRNFLTNDDYDSAKKEKVKIEEFKSLICCLNKKYEEDDKVKSENCDSCDILIKKLILKVLIQDIDIGGDENKRSAKYKKANCFFLDEDCPEKK
jgi:hypothetical protein